MSNETTPAIERAAEALVLQEGILDWAVLSEQLREAPRDQVRDILAAALPVEEMAGVLYVSEHPYDTLENWRNHGSEQSKAVYYRLATAVRAAILGGAS